MSENTKKIPWWIGVILFLIACAGSYFIISDLYDFHTKGGEIETLKIILVIYDYIGFWGVVGSCIAICIYLLYMTISEYFKQKKNA